MGQGRLHGSEAPAPEPCRCVSLGKVHPPDLRSIHPALTVSARRAYTVDWTPSQRTGCRSSPAGIGNRLEGLAATEGAGFRLSPQRLWLAEGGALVGARGHYARAAEGLWCFGYQKEED